MRRSDVLVTSLVLMTSWHVKGVTVLPEGQSARQEFNPSQLISLLTSMAAQSGGLNFLQQQQGSFQQSSPTQTAPAQFLNTPSSVSQLLGGLQVRYNPPCHISISQLLGRLQVDTILRASAPWWATGRYNSPSLSSLVDTILRLSASWWAKGTIQSSVPQILGRLQVDTILRLSTPWWATVRYNTSSLSSLESYMYDTILRASAPWWATGRYNPPCLSFLVGYRYNPPSLSFLVGYMYDTILRASAPWSATGRYNPPCLSFLVDTILRASAPWWATGRYNPPSLSSWWATGRYNSPSLSFLVGYRYDTILHLSASWSATGRYNPPSLSFLGFADYLPEQTGSGIGQFLQGAGQFFGQKPVPYPGNYGLYPPQQNLGHYPGEIGSYPGGDVQYPGSEDSQGTSLIGALSSIARYDDLKCVPRLLCEVAAGGKPGNTGKQDSIIPFLSRDSLLTLLTVFNFGDTSPLLVFGRAMLLGITAQGRPESCLSAYPTCPRDPEQLVYYLNNHHGGFFQFFNNLQRPSVVRPYYHQGRIQNTPQQDSTASITPPPPNSHQQNIGHFVDLYRPRPTVGGSPNKYIHSTRAEKAFKFPDGDEQADKNDDNPYSYKPLTDVSNHHSASIEATTPTYTSPFLDTFLSQNGQFNSNEDSSDSTFFVNKRKNKGFAFSSYSSQSEKNEEKYLEKPLLDHKPAHMIFPDRTGTGDLRLDVDDSDGANQFFRQPKEPVKESTETDVNKVLFYKKFHNDYADQDINSHSNQRDGGYFRFPSKEEDSAYFDGDETNDGFMNDAIVDSELVNSEGIEPRPAMATAFSITHNHM
uniref:Uncharacterized protein n=2 Tax=Timema TaxID=61471 RepID=A0A7R9G067_TIMSH|nr:unnamed protein product [Timema shepardi]